MRTVLTVATSRREELVDITVPVKNLVAGADPCHELCSIFVLGATAGIMIQENWDPHIGADVIDCLARLAPRGIWRHDRIDGNGDSHIKAGLVGPSEVIPIRNGELLLGTWQNIFLCEFDGPRQRREVVITLV